MASFSSALQSGSDSRNAKFRPPVGRAGWRAVPRWEHRRRPHLRPVPTAHGCSARRPTALSQGVSAFTGRSRPAATRHLPARRAQRVGLARHQHGRSLRPDRSGYRRRSATRHRASQTRRSLTGTTSQSRNRRCSPTPPNNSRRSSREQQRTCASIPLKLPPITFLAIPASNDTRILVINRDKLRHMFDQRILEAAPDLSDERTQQHLARRRRMGRARRLRNAGQLR